MKVTPVASPHAIAHPVTTNTTAARTKAIEAFAKASEPAAPTQGQAQETPVKDPNSISPEEMSAIKPQTAESVDKSAVSDPQPEETEAKPQDPELTKQFANLAKQERNLRIKAQQQQNALKAREQALNAREQALQAKPEVDLSQYVPKARLKSDPLGALIEAGSSYDDVSQQALTLPNRDPRVEATISELRAEIEALKNANTETQKSYAQQQTDAYNAALKQIERDAQTAVKSDPVTYEAISKTPGAIKEVVKLIKMTYEKDGIVLSVEEAAEAIENEIIDRSFKSASQVDKIKKRIAQAAAGSSSKPPQEQTATPKQTQMKTLTNATSSQRQLSAKERAILAFKGELKS